jgi:hypothetical protein
MGKVDSQSLAKEITKCVAGRALKSLACFHGIGTAENPDFIESVGTGFLLGIGSRTFIVTARHVLEEIKAPGRKILSFSCGRNGNIPQELTEHQLGLAHTVEQDDVGIFELTPQQVEYLKQSKDFNPLSLKEIIPFFNPKPNDPVVVTGFPIELSETNNVYEAVNDAMIFFGLLTPKTPTGFNNYQKDKHILLDYDRNYSVGFSGLQGEPPDPFGMSGGVIWTVRANKPSSKIWLPVDDVKIVGLCTRWYDKEQIICGSKMYLVFELAAKKWPELEADMNEQLYIQG